MLKCPRCNEPLELHLNEYRNKGADYEEVEFKCPNNHEYFVRIKEKDLLEAN